MRPALESLTAANFYDRSVQDSATEFVKLAVSDMIEKIKKNEKISNTTRNFITNKLKLVKLSVMFPDDILNLTKISSLYDELEFKGNESLPEMHMKLVLHCNKLRNKPPEHWIKKLTTIVNAINIRYFVEMNVFSKF